MTLTFSAVDLTSSQIETYRTAAMDSAIAVHDQMWEEGLVTSDMTEWGKGPGLLYLDL